MTISSGQYGLLVKNFASPLPDSSVSFWVRVGPGGGLESIAQARDQSSSQHIWGLLYDGSQHGFYFYPFRGSSSTEIFTGRDSAGADTWVKVEIQYNASSDGGARIYLNGQTQSLWAVSGDYTRSANLQKLQLWNDAGTTTDFDDVTVATPAPPPPPAANPPGAPTAVQGSPGDKQVGLSWTAPGSDGGSPISGYRITPYVGTSAQTPVTTTTSATSQTVTGLTNGTAYTFKVAAINAAGTGPDSNASAPITPTTAAATAPGPPTPVQRSAGHHQVDLNC